MRCVYFSMLDDAYSRRAAIVSFASGYPQKTSRYIIGVMAPFINRESVAIWRRESGEMIDSYRCQFDVEKESKCSSPARISTSISLHSTLHLALGQSTQVPRHQPWWPKSQPYVLGIECSFDDW